MRALLQRVKKAEVTVDNKVVGSIGYGLLVFLGVAKTDTLATTQKLLDKILGYRIFPDHNDHMNKSILDIQGSMLVVSQFTLMADTQSGLRPSFTPAALPADAQILYNHFIQKATLHGLPIASGIFGAQMEVSLTNDGPVTFLLDTEKHTQ